MTETNSSRGDAVRTHISDGETQLLSVSIVSPVSFHYGMSIWTPGSLSLMLSALSVDFLGRKGPQTPSPGSESAVQWRLRHLPPMLPLLWNVHFTYHPRYATFLLKCLESEQSVERNCSNPQVWYQSKMGALEDEVG